MRIATTFLLLCFILQDGQTEKEQARAHYQTAIVALEHKDMSVAAAELRAAVKLDPENGLLHFKLALVLRELDAPAAESSLKTALRLGLPESERDAARELGAQLAYASLKRSEAASALLAAKERATREAQALRDERNRVLAALSGAAGTWRAEFGDRKYKSRIEVKLRPTEQGATGSFACRSTDRGASWSKCESMDCVVDGSVCRGRGTSCSHLGSYSSPVNIEINLTRGGEVVFTADNVCSASSLLLSR